MNRIRRLAGMITAAAMVPCVMGTTVFAAPSTDELKAQKAEAQQEAESLQKQLTELLNKVGEMEEQLIETGEKITETEADLETAQAKAEDQYAKMKLRIKYMYEDGGTDLFGVLLSSENFSDFLNQAEYISNVNSYDRQKLNELKETQEKIAALKETLETEQTNLEKMQKEYQAEEDSVNEELEEKSKEIDNFDVQIQAAAEAAAAEAEARAEEEAQAADPGEGTTGKQSTDAADVPSNGSSSGSQTSGNTGGSSGTSSSGSGNSGSSSSGTSSSGSSSSSSSSSGSGSSGSGSSGSGSSGSSSSGSSSSGNSSSGNGSYGTNTSAAQKIVAAAYSQLGVPYVYGGTTPGVGLDCSGLVQYCYAAAGISLPRTSTAQGGSGIAVTDPQPGDIVCYSGHVGIYIGNGQMIHAPQTGDVVKIADVYGSPWYRRCW